MQKNRNRRPLSPTDPLDGFAEEPGRIVIAGGSGFLGQVLSRRLEQKGHDVVILSRRPARKYGNIRTVIWDGKTLGDWTKELEGAQAVVNLTGRSVACLYTRKNKRQIMSSRLDSVRALSRACAACAEPPEVMVQASSLAIYGDAGDQICDEQAAHGVGFSVEVCEAWEHAFFTEPETGGPRRVALRIGFVLGRDGGALRPLANLARCYLGGTVGNGQQYISWLDIEDFCRMVSWVIRRPASQGIYNATSTTPVTNAEFMRTLRKAVDRPWSPDVPVWAVKFGARFILRADPSLALSGRRCIPRRLLSEGFVLQQPRLDLSMWDLLKKSADVM